MARIANTRFVAPPLEAFKIAKTKAIKGHRTWLLFQRKDGDYEGWVYSAAGIKAAMLEVGLKGRFYWFDANSGISNVCRSWGYGNHLLRCAKGAELHGFSSF